MQNKIIWTTVVFLILFGVIFLKTFANKGNQKQLPKDSVLSVESGIKNVPVPDAASESFKNSVNTINEVQKINNLNRKQQKK